MVNRLHVVKNHTNGWDVKREGVSRAFVIGAPTQRDAYQMARQAALAGPGSEILIHGRDGRIRESNTIGKKDPFPPRG